MSRDDGFPGSDGGGRGRGWVAVVVIVRDEVIGVDVVEHGRAESGPVGRVGVEVLKAIVDEVDHRDEEGYCEGTVLQGSSCASDSAV